MDLSCVHYLTTAVLPCDFLDGYSYCSNKQPSCTSNYPLLYCNNNNYKKKRKRKFHGDGVTSSKDGDQNIIKQKARILEFKEENMPSIPMLDATNCPFQMKNLSIEVGIGKGRVLREGRKVAILGYGSVVENCLTAAALLQVHGISATVAEALFCEPLDGDLVRRLAQHHQVLLIVEEGNMGGGFASHVSYFLASNGLLEQNLKFQGLMLPDRSYMMKQGSGGVQMESAGIAVKQIASTVLSLVADGQDVFFIM